MARKLVKFILLPAFALTLLISATPVLAQTTESSSQCWSKSDCVSKTENCEACFEPQETFCGAGRGFCYAKPVPATLEISLGGLNEVSDPAQYISKLYEWTISITGILAGIMIMIGGLLYLTAGGSPERVSNAKSYISNALIGLILALTSYFLLQTVNPALLNLRFPKVPLVQAVVPPSDFCEDLAENSDIQITSSTGGTKCGDMGIPHSISGASSVPTKCAYGSCTNPEESCEINPEALGPVAECKKVAGVRMDLFLAERRKKFGYSPTFTTNATEFLSSSMVLAEKEDLTEACQQWAPRSQNGIIYRVFPTASCDLLSDIGSAAFLENTGMILGIWTGADSLYHGAKLGIQSTQAGSKVGQVLGGVELGIGAFEAKSTVRAVMKHPAVTLIVGSIIASVAVYEGVMCNVNAPLRGNAACSLAAIDCKQIKSCGDYDKTDIKAEKTKNIQDISPEDYLGMTSVEMHTEICNDDPCQLPFNCQRSLGNYIPWNPDSGSIGDIAYSEPYTSNNCSASGLTFRPIPGASSAAKCCERDVVGPIYSGFNSEKKQKLGQLCETNDDCQAPLTCNGTTVTLKNVLIPCQGYQNPDPSCTEGWIAPGSATAGGVSCESVCDDDRQYWAYAKIFKKEDKTLRRCQ